jgi:sugar phosphate isomerase/epimerase
VRITRENGLEIPAYSADLQPYPFAEGDERIMRKHEDSFEKSLDFCVDCDIPAIRVDTVTKTPFPENLDHQTTWNRVVAVFQKLADKALSAGKTVIWEFEPGLIFNKPHEVIRLTEEVSSVCANFKILFDTSHAHMCGVVASKQVPPFDQLEGGVVEFIELLSGRIGHVHLADSDSTLHDDDTSTHAPLGHGVLDFKRILKAIQKSGYDSPWWSIDLCFWPEAWQVTDESKNFLENLFREINWS